MQDVLILVGATVLLTIGICTLWWPEQLQRIKGSTQPIGVTIQLRIFGCLCIIGSGVAFLLELKRLLR